MATRHRVSHIFPDQRVLKWMSRRVHVWRLTDAAELASTNTNISK